MSATTEPLLIDGSTRLFGIIGHPIGQVGAPKLFTTRFRAAGINAVLVPFHLLPERFDETVRGLKSLANLDGLVITVPYKLRSMEHVDRVLPTGEQIGAINVMRREPDGTWTGDHFDGKGFLNAMTLHGHSVKGKRAMVMGTGGAGSAIVVALADAGAAAITLFDADESKAKALAVRVRKYFPKVDVNVGPAATKGYDILANATPVGMKPDDGLPAPLGTLDPSLVVFDAIMKPEVTPLLRHAKECGCPTVGGRFMLQGQGDEFMAFFRQKC